MQLVRGGGESLIISAACAAALLACGGSSDEPGDGAGDSDAADVVDTGGGVDGTDTDVADPGDTPSPDTSDGDEPETNGDTDVVVPDVSDVDSVSDGDEQVDADADTADVPAGPNACGGAGSLVFGGVVSSPGSACGCDGFLACDGTDALVCLSSTPVNACGGCEELGVSVGLACGSCAGDVWTCDGADAVTCSGSDEEPNACGGCGTLAGVPLALCDDSEAGAGLWVCSSPDEVLCLGAGRNACGGLEVLPQTVGAPCGECGAGRVVCNGRDAVVCRGGDDATNACGGCAPLAGDIGSACGTCGGTWVCDAGNPDRALCSASRNPCGGCGALTGGSGPGETCVGGVTYCATSSRLDCGDAELNACGGRTSLDAVPGAACGGCDDGVQVCAGTDRVVCVDASVENACGGCGLLAGVPGTSCGVNRVWECAADDTVTCAASSTSLVVDSSRGGTTTLGGAQLTVPAGAVANPTLLTIERTDITTVDGYTLTSPVYRFGPAGTVFSSPLTVRVATGPPADGRSVDLWWSRRTGSGYSSVTTSRPVGAVEGQVTHFSEGFAGYITELSADEVCDNRVDDDGDGLSDCADPDCLDTAICPLDCTGVVCDAPPASTCSSNSVRGYSPTGRCRFGRGCEYTLAPSVPCSPGTCLSGVCIPPEDCSTVGDEDGNGLADCADPVCAAELACLENCGTPGDEDGNGLADCADPACDVEVACYEGAVDQCLGAGDADLLSTLTRSGMNSVVSECEDTCSGLTIPNCIAQCIATETGLSAGCGSCVPLASGPAEVCAGVCVDALGCALPIEMLPIPAGSFTMGSPPNELGREESGTDETAHTVTLTRTFLLSRTEVTQGQWQNVMNTNPSLLDNPNLPVVGVNWWDTLEFANRLSQSEGLAACYTLTGCGGTPGTNFSCTGATVTASGGNPLLCAGYRLPTESEWEYAYRVRRTRAFYNGDITHTGSTPLDLNLDAIGWYSGNSSGRQVVGQKLPNAWGLYDMAGNVFEWCWDWYGTYPGAVSDPLGPATGSLRVVRGGSFLDVASAARAAGRLSDGPSSRVSDFGFRLARTAP